MDFEKLAQVLNDEQISQVYRPHMVDYIEDFVNKTEIYPVNPAIVALLDFVSTRKDHPLFSEALEVLKTGANKTAYKEFWRIWEQTDDPDIFALIPKNQYWELAGKLRNTADFKSYSQFSLQNALENLVNNPEKNTSVTYELVSLYLKNKYADLRPEIEPFLKCCGRAVTIAWERNQSPLLEPFLQKGRYWELAGKLIKRLSGRNRYDLQYSLEKIKTERYDTLLKEILEVTVQCGNPLKTELLDLFSELEHPL
jgi:hypothetical protein